MHTPLTTSLQTAPGGVGFTLGENELPSPGPTAFSVGDTAGAEEPVVAVVGAEVGVLVFDVLVGASFSAVGLHPVSVPMVSSAVAAPRSNPRPNR